MNVGPQEAGTGSDIRSAHPVGIDKELEIIKTIRRHEDPRRDIGSSNQMSIVQGCIQRHAVHKQVGVAGGESDCKAVRSTYG